MAATRKLQGMNFWICKKVDGEKNCCGRTITRVAYLWIKNQLSPKSSKLCLDKSFESMHEKRVIPIFSLQINILKVYPHGQKKM